MKTSILFDKQQMIGSILNLTKQIQHVLKDNQFLKYPKNKLDFNKIIIVGIGSSLIAYKIIESIYRHEFGIPIYCLNEGRLPSWVDNKTIVILSSYSGNTREVINLAKKILTKDAIIIAITSGGKLINLLKNKAYFIYVINKKLFNPCKQPRMAIGYSFAAFFKILILLGIIKTNSKELFNKLHFNFDKKDLFTKMREISSKLKGKSIDIVSSGYLSGNAELFFKQLNWNSKQQASYHIVPEAMHYLVEGLSHPKHQKKGRIFVLIKSHYMNKEEKNDLFILKKYLAELSHNMIFIFLKEKNKLNQVIELMVKTSLISYFLALLNKENPTPTPGIDYYKLNLN